MSFDRGALAAAIAAHGPVARIVIAGLSGSSPREAGAAMLVWADGTEGTIGGGALEWQAMAEARAMLGADGSAIRGRRPAAEAPAQPGTAPPPPARIARLPLGPALGQCCGGAVTLVTEIWDAARLAALPEGDTIARPLRDVPEPFALRRLRARIRARGEEAPTRLTGDWLIEPAARPTRRIWIWGAGHVGRALAGVIAPLPGLAITWIDTAEDRFPPAEPAGQPAPRRLAAAQPADLVPLAPRDAEHLILTYSHALDLELCHRLLAQGFGTCGLIGSATKWARFRARLRALGHAEAQIARIRCPIGDPELGKHPQAIAVGVAAALLGRSRACTASTERTA